MQKSQIYFFGLLSLGVLLLSFYIFLPFLVPVSIAAALAVVFYPLYERVRSFLGGYAGISAFITVLVAVVLLLIPLTIIGTMVFQEARVFVEQIAHGGVNTNVLPAFIKDYIQSFFPNFALNTSEYVRYAATWLIQNLGGILSRVVQISISLFLGLLTFYYLLKNGKELLQKLIVLSPLADVYDREILTTLGNAINSIVRGSLSIALIQGILTGVGFSIFNVPNPALFGSIAAVTALIPGIGTALVIVPAVIFLFVMGDTGSATGLLIWGIVAVGLIDNVLGPLLMKRGIRVHPFLILLSVIGGLSFFGPIGFLLGPLVLSLLCAIVEIYEHLRSTNGKHLST